KVKHAKKAKDASHALNADNATHATTADNATHATTADAATTAINATTASNGAAAYAHLLQDGTFDASESTGLGSATVAHTTGTGIYCISGLPFTPKNVVATPDSR